MHSTFTVCAYISKKLLTDCFPTNKHNNNHHDETLILSCIGGDTISYGLSKKTLDTYCNSRKGTVHRKEHNVLSGSIPSSLNRFC